jgi:hypothetical protein
MCPHDERSIILLLYSPSLSAIEQILNMGSETNRKALAKSAKQKRKIFCAGIAAFVALLPLLSKEIRSSIKARGDEYLGSPTYVQFPQTGGKIKEVEPIDFSQFEHCENAKFNVSQPAGAEASTKPIWFTAVPHRISDRLHKTLINTMTGLAAGGKSFIASSRGLKHCIGHGQTATCLGGIIDPNRFDFYEKYIIHVRNPMTGFPAGYNLKSMLYRHLDGQNTIDEWRAVRDKYGDGVIEEFSTSISNWNSSKFDVGMYLVHEDLLDIDKGVETLKKLRSFLIEAGFQVVPEDELSCVWYLSVGKETIDIFHKFGYEYSDYIPGYTEAQKAKFLEDMKEYRKKVGTDLELVGILDRYISDMETKTVIDVPAAVKEEENA